MGACGTANRIPQAGPPDGPIYFHCANPPFSGAPVESARHTVLPNARTSPPRCDGGLQGDAALTMPQDRLRVRHVGRTDRARVHCRDSISQNPGPGDSHRLKRSRTSSARWRNRSSFTWYVPSERIPGNSTRRPPESTGPSSRTAPETIELQSRSALRRGLPLLSSTTLSSRLIGPSLGGLEKHRVRPQLDARSGRYLAAYPHSSKYRGYRRGGGASTSCRSSAEILSALGANCTDSPLAASFFSASASRRDAMVTRRSRK